MSALRKGRFKILGIKLMSALILISMYSCTQMPLYREDVYFRKLRYPVVRVKLLKSKDEMQISPAGALAIKCYTQNGNEKNSEYFSSAQVWLRTDTLGIALGVKDEDVLERNLQKVVFEPRGKDQWFFLNGKRYRGVLEIDYSSKDTSSLALNTVFVEDYLKGVLPAEMGNWGKSELEALKAQAVAARTYALYSSGSNRENGHYLESTVADQVYSGADCEDQFANQAIKKTEGMVLSYAGKLIKAHYHANCGGYTEGIEEVWDRPPEPYLSSFGDNAFCNWAKNSTWEESWTREELEEVVSTYLRAYQELPAEGIGKILDLQILAKSPSGRVSILELITDKSTFKLERDNIRWVLRREKPPHTILPSTFFDIELLRNSSGDLEKVVFRGYGNGHGVGMCQTGALGRSRAGHTYKAILSTYYRGAKIIKLY